MRLTAEGGAPAIESGVASAKTNASPSTQKRARESEKANKQQQHRKVKTRKAAETTEGDTITVDVMGRLSRGC
ncbi:MAG: hypothetical protein CL912_11605 [Deltaproteobacteria bacterium]|nr:hypothetical protein [Deltaproteobacteria bacterium]|tara:strand:+ start:119 stop:337 length:219 start_codon:yes stop_codon:yes gene_type:complete